MPMESSGTGGSPRHFDQYDWPTAQFWKQRTLRENSSSPRHQAWTLPPPDVQPALTECSESRGAVNFSAQLRPMTTGMPLGRRWPAHKLCSSLPRPQSQSARVAADRMEESRSSSDSGFGPPVAWPPRALGHLTRLTKFEQQYDLNHDGVLDHRENAIKRFDKNAANIDDSASSVFTPPHSPSAANAFARAGPMPVNQTRNASGNACELCRADRGCFASATFGVAGQHTARWCTVCAAKAGCVGQLVRVACCANCKSFLGEEPAQRPPRQLVMYCQPCASKRVPPPTTPRQAQQRKTMLAESPKLASPAAQSVTPLSPRHRRRYQSKHSYHDTRSSRLSYLF